MITKMKDNKGFTLIEVLLALSIITIAIFVFTPIIAYSFKSINDMGQARGEIYSERKDIEIKIAGNNSDGSDALKIVFEKGSDHKIVDVNGKRINDSKNSILSFITNTKGDSVKISIESRTSGYTNKFSEDSWNDVAGTVVDVLTNNNLFTDVTKFSVINNVGTVVISNTGFTITDIKNANFTLPIEPLPASGSPYKVCYEEYYAYMFIGLSSFDGVDMIAVGNSDHIILSEGFVEGSDPKDIKFYDGGTINSETDTVINDIVWIPSTDSNPNAGKFVAVGNNGYYLEIGETVAQDSYYNEVDLTKMIFTPGLITSFSDFNAIASMGAGSEPIFVGGLSYTVSDPEVQTNINSLFKLEGGTLIPAIDNSLDTEHKYVDVAYGDYNGNKRTILLDTIAKKAVYRDGNTTFGDLNTVTNKSDLRAVAIGTINISTLDISAYVIVYGTNAYLRYDGILDSGYKDNVNLGYTANSVAYAKKDKYSRMWVVVGNGGSISYCDLKPTTFNSNTPFYMVTSYIDSIDGVPHNFIDNLDTIGNLNKVVVINDRFYAVGDSGVILSSGDGKTWYRHYIYDDNDVIVSNINLNSIAGR